MTPNLNRFRPDTLARIAARPGTLQQLAAHLAGHLAGVTSAPVYAIDTKITAPCPAPADTSEAGWLAALRAALWRASLGRRVFLGRPPKSHHPLVLGRPAKHVYVLDESVDVDCADGPDGWIRLPVNTAVIVTGGGTGPSGRRGWAGRLDDGAAQVSIPTE